jgi:hypothetical protein
LDICKADRTQSAPIINYGVQFDAGINPANVFNIAALPSGSVLTVAILAACIAHTR